MIIQRRRKKERERKGVGERRKTGWRGDRVWGGEKMRISLHLGQTIAARLIEVNGND